jgi:beta-alanine--pyruvate transaminase
MPNALEATSLIEHTPPSTAAASPGIPEMQHQWLPFTPNRDFSLDPKLFTRASGVNYYDPTGRPVLDGVSGLFTVPAGHGRAEIADAVRDQILELDFTPSFLRAHPKSFALATKLTALLPAGINRIFFAASGSEAIDTAMKIALAYHRARKDSSRTMFVSRERAYHGVNFGGTALSGLVNNRRAFGNPVAGVVHMRHTWQADNRFTPGQPARGAELADDLTRFVQLYGAENIAACFVEPIAGSTGTLVPPVGYLERLREICTKHGILLVFDEVITGFGRTGQAFAAQSFGVTPDIITMAKALTNGSIPMSAVAVREEIHQTIMDAAPANEIEFYHGYTWSAHPVACAGALAALEIYEKEDLFARGRELSPYFLERLFGLAGHPEITDIRGYGMMGGIDIKPGAKPGHRGYALQKRLYDLGLHVKTNGDCACIAPPLIFTRQNVDTMVDILKEGLSSVCLP